MVGQTVGVERWGLVRGGWGQIISFIILREQCGIPIRRIFTYATLITAWAANRARLLLNPALRLLLRIDCTPNAFSNRGMPDSASVRIECINPILRVADMKRALQFYVDLLGFKAADWGDESFTAIARDNSSLYLCCGAQGRGAAWIWIGVEDVEAFYNQIKSLPIKIRMAPTNYPWALEMHVEDPDGNVLRFGSEPKNDRPFRKDFPID